MICVLRCQIGAGGHSGLQMRSQFWYQALGHRKYHLDLDIFFLGYQLPRSGLLNTGRRVSLKRQPIIIRHGRVELPRSGFWVDRSIDGQGDLCVQQVGPMSWWICEQIDKTWSNDRGWDEE